MSTYAPSVYQQKILDFVRDDKRSAVVVARAGSGKTSTLMMLDALAADLDLTRIFLAFNKSIATELQSRGANARTFHSAAFSSVMRGLDSKNNGRRIKVEAWKVSNIVENIFGKRFECGSALVKLVGLMKNHAMRPNATDCEIINLISHFDIEWDDDSITDQKMCQYARDVLKKNNEDTLVIDFDDQLYFVILFDLKMPTYDLVLVDESQDTNPTRRMVVQKMLHKGSRVIAVGDDKQAIYGFTGASHDSLDQIAQTFNAVRLPLSISYRCPASVIRLAQTIVPDIQARDNAPEGKVEYARTFKRSAFASDDLIICRNTAPLVQTAYKLIAARIPCKIMGREIGKGLIALIKKVSRRNETIETLPDSLTAYQEKEVSKALAARKESLAQSITDKVESLVTLINSMTPDDTDRGIPGLVSIIENMFSDNGPKVTTLATVHKAKGMEATRVFILDSHLMPSKYARQDWQKVQEENLRYVAITRSLDTLVFVDSKALTE